MNFSSPVILYADFKGADDRQDDNELIINAEVNHVPLSILSAANANVRYGYFKSGAKASCVIGYKDKSSLSP
jgi:hypothetical protein